MQDKEWIIWASNERLFKWSDDASVSQIAFEWLLALVLDTKVDFPGHILTWILNWVLNIVQFSTNIVQLNTVHCNPFLIQYIPIHFSL